jgi:hypothetical protein
MKHHGEEVMILTVLSVLDFGRAYSDTSIMSDVVGFDA